MEISVDKDISMTHPNLKEILSRIKKELTRVYGKRIHEVRLFGSQARGDASSESDIDVIVVLTDLSVHISREQDLFFPFKYNLEKEFGTLIQVIFTTKERFDKSKAPLYVGVREESVAI